ncbi:transmembrane protein 87A [Condylostylus longicornis]|uniref:transmembrane protein 87A n=1 Tax=Condylostylus longicornis TaxID=2530218 RepID=UPI00244D9E3F|nr:transmembrane protein 87A [Condylostylus longicornis]
MPKLKYVIIVVSVFFLPFICGKSEQGKTDSVLSKKANTAKAEKTLFAGSQIFVQITCEKNSDFLEIYWTLSKRRCWEDESNMEYQAPQSIVFSGNETITSNKMKVKCVEGQHIILDSLLPEEKPSAGNEKKKPTIQIGDKIDKPVYTVLNDGIYDFVLYIESGGEFQTPVHIEIRGPHGYLSAVEWPLLPFYGIMCLVYVILGITWLIVSFAQWRDLLRIQFWIGGVILLGMLEKAVFYAEYQSVNSTGISVQGAELAAEIVSCAKRTLARMLVIIMSLGFGIVKPRLGPMLHRVVGTGALYFILACVESYLRVMRTKNNQRHELLVASIPLAVLDSGICWWIFTSLVQTTRTLRLRRNTVKLSLYRHFTNTLIFSVLASVVFMLYSIKAHKLENCSPYWRDIWVDIAFWHVLFSVLLLVIMILWRPTNNNQRYAFTPLLDNPEDEDEEEEQFVSDAYGVKMRGANVNTPKTPPPKTTTTEEDDLRWVEENIPSAIQEPTLPVLDSDEEILNTKFEVSKMQ